MLTLELIIEGFDTYTFEELYSTLLFRQLQELFLRHEGWDEIDVMPYLEQIKILTVLSAHILSYSLDIDLPLIHTLKQLTLGSLSCSWMYGRAFPALKSFEFHGYLGSELYGHNGPQVDMPACTEVKQPEQVPLLLSPV